MSGYKLLLVDEDWTAPAGTGTAFVVAGTPLGKEYTGPFEVIADVGDDHRLRMSRALYDTIEVVDP